MSTYHAIVWIDHAQAHVLMFDREHVQAQRIKSRSHYSHNGKDPHDAAYFPAVASALTGTHEVLLAGPADTRTRFREWCVQHQPAVAKRIVDSVPSDHPTDPQLVAMARQYFTRFDNMATDPVVAAGL
jgi:stalled ribosome rescue protein Dom34